MSRYNVKLPDGRWQCFSTVCDDFVCEPMEKEDYAEWRKVQYGIANYKPAEKCNMMDYEEALERKNFNPEEEE